MTKTLSQKEVKKLFQQKRLAISQIDQVIKDLQKEEVPSLEIVDVLLKYASDLGKESPVSREKLKDVFSKHVDGKVLY